MGILMGILDDNIKGCNGYKGLANWDIKVCDNTVQCL